MEQTVIINIDKLIDNISITHPSQADNHQALNEQPEHNEIEVLIKASDLSEMINEIKRLRYHEATTVGLWAIDQKPSKVNHKWIRKNAFKIKKLGTHPLS
ncbi:hypothetical protein ACUXZJ_11345 [Flavobacterium sp. TN-1]